VPVPLYATVIQAAGAAQTRAFVRKHRCLHYEISDMLRKVFSFRLTEADGCEDSANKVEAGHVHISQVLI
jgi:hypothetical protein